VTLRGITLGELTPERVRTLVGKEALLGLCNGALVGITAGLGMLIYASLQKNPAAPDARAHCFHGNGLLLRDLRRQRARSSRSR
jgi:Mg/Co/Ni transporter MgtE